MTRGIAGGEGEKLHVLPGLHPVYIPRALYCRCLLWEEFQQTSPLRSPGGICPHRCLVGGYGDDACSCKFFAGRAVTTIEAAARSYRGRRHGGDESAGNRAETFPATTRDSGLLGTAVTFKRSDAKTVFKCDCHSAREDR